MALDNEARQRVEAEHRPVVLLPVAPAEYISKMTQF